MILYVLNLVQAFTWQVHEYLDIEEYRMVKNETFVQDAAQF